jgi:hypothetical protein
MFKYEVHNLPLLLTHGTPALQQCLHCNSVCKQSAQSLQAAAAIVHCTHVSGPEAQQAVHVGPRVGRLCLYGSIGNLGGDHHHHVTS